MREYINSDLWSQITRWSVHKYIHNVTKVMCALYVRCVLSVLQKDCRKVWGARYKLGARYWSENTVTKIIFDSVNHTRFPREDHLPDMAHWENQVKKSDRVVYIYMCVCVCVCVYIYIHIQWTLELRPAWHTNNLGYDQNFSFDLQPKSWVTTRMPVKAKTRGYKQRPEMRS